MKRADMTDLQRLLYDEYFRRWGVRRDAVAHVAHVLGRLDVARGEAKKADDAFQRVFALMAEIGLEMEPVLRTWPAEMPQEYVLTGNEAVPD